MRTFTIAGPVWKNLSTPVTAWRQSIAVVLARRCQLLADARPRGYLLCAGATALAGYLYLLMFPWLVLAGCRGIYAATSSAQGMAWIPLVIWLAVAACAGLTSYRLYRFRPALPAGSELDAATYPALWQLVAEQTRHYRSTGIDRIVLSGDFALEVRKTPRFALPLWSTTTLVVGLPLLQSLSESHFQCLLARRLGQFSKRYNWLENWLNQLREIWPQYCDHALEGGPGYQPVAWFFTVYAPFYRLLTAPAAQFDELAADRYAMELFTDEEVLDAIVTHAVCRRYLADKYWPVVRKYAAKNGRVLDRLHAGMAAVLRAGLQADTVHHWLTKTLSADDQPGDSVPALARRIDNIGFGKAGMGALAAGTAAGVYLGAAGPVPGAVHTEA